MAGRDPRRTFLWLPDDDVIASACNITRFLRLMEAQQLVLAQVGRGAWAWLPPRLAILCRNARQSAPSQSSSPADVGMPG